jgi:hypothetical protein
MAIRAQGQERDGRCTSGNNACNRASLICGKKPLNFRNELVFAMDRSLRALGSSIKKPPLPADRGEGVMIGTRIKGFRVSFSNVRLALEVARWANDLLARSRAE